MWSVGYVSPRFMRFATSLTPWKQAVLRSVIENVLMVAGINICDSEWGKPLGGGLYELRIRRAPSLPRGSEQGEKLPGDASAGGPVLLRVFCVFYQSQAIGLLSGYDKGRDSSPRRQAREIALARKEQARWKKNI